MRKYLFFLLFSGFLLAQTTVNIAWDENPSTYFPSDISENIYPVFTNGIYTLNSKGIPTFIFHEATASQQDITVSLQWKEIPSSELYDIPKENISKTDAYIAKTSKARNDYSIYIEVETFKKEQGKYFRLESFDYSLSPNSSKSSGYQLTTFGDSELRNGNFYKIKVDTTGVFRINANFFTQNGISLQNINPSNLRIYGNGGRMLSETVADFRYEDVQENAIMVVGGEDGSFDQNDYILFYAQGPDSWDRNTNTPPYHEKNIYSDEAYYFINFDKGPGKRVADISTTPTANPFTTFDDYRFVDKEDQNISNLGRIWLGDDFSLQNSQTYEFSIHDIDPTYPMFYTYSVVSRFGLNNSVSLSVNGQQVNNFTITNNSEFVEHIRSGNTTVSTNTLQAEVQVENLNPSGIIYFNYIEFRFRQNLSFNGTQMNFRRFGLFNNNTAYGFKITNETMDYVWDVSDITNAKNMLDNSTGPGFDFTFQSDDENFPNEFVAFNASAAYTPEWVGRVNNQNLHGLDNIEYVIVSHPNYLSEALKLKNYHDDKYNTVIVTPEEIYNEFSSGSQDISAIRDFFSYLYKKDGDLQFALLLGGASFDYKDRINNNTNYIPAYTDYNTFPLPDTSNRVTDDFYTILDDSDVGLSTSQMDIGIGRIPATNNSEAVLLTKKILDYVNASVQQSTPFGDWRLKMQFISDDDKDGIDPSFHYTVDQRVVSIIENDHPIYAIKKLYIDAFEPDYSIGGQRFPQVTQAMINGIDTGVLLVNYFGHGGPLGWAQERILLAQDVDFSNLNEEYARLPLMITITCDFTVWDNPNSISVGELILKNTEGGTFAMLTTSRPIGVVYAENFNPILITEAFELTPENQYLPLGEGIRRAKVMFPSSDNLKVNFLGDPAVPLAYPPRKIQITEINGVPYSSFNGTIQALDFVTVSGEVLDNAATSKDTSYNGEATLILYDKPQQKQTRNNDGNLPILNFTEQVNSIFKGSTTVENGDFTFEFYVPKDINYTIGAGKMVLYAEDDEVDASTVDTTIQIGGINPNGIDDDEGPSIKLFMNNTHFANGGITNRNPLFIACVTDSTGINSSGTGVGHDITAVLDGNIEETLVLNEYYIGGEQSPCSYPTLKDYQKGKVAYQFKDLPLGPHTIEFKIWDINNNSSTATLDFVVVNNGEDNIVINRPLNWPNPFTDKTYFHFEHNCDDILEVQVQIFTISGKLVKTINQTVSSDPFREGYRTDKFGIEWDGLDDFGDRIGRGTYVYKLTVNGQDREQCKGTATAFEKLVILK